jgi:hypothetical protein
LGVENRVLVRTKRRRQLSVFHEAAELEELLGGLPGDLCETKIVSFCRLSTAAFVQWIGNQTVIRRLSLTTFRIGPRALKMLSELHGQERLNEARFVVGRLASSPHRGNNERDYWYRLLDLCDAYGWEVCSIANHSKFALFDTEDGRFVLEGSANLNEAPNWEQYTIQKDDELYEFYDKVLDEMFAFAAKAAEQLPIQEAEEDQEGLTWPEQKGRDLIWPEKDRRPLW